MCVFFFLVVLPSLFRPLFFFFRFAFLCLFSSYAFCQPLIDLIDSQCVIRKRFYRDSCIQREGSSSSSSPRDIGRNRGAKAGNTAAASGGRGRALAAAAAGGAVDGGASVPSETMKDLEVVRSEHFPLRTVLVDNRPRAVIQQANVLPVKSWYPRDSQDRQLLELLPVLLALTSCQDVRSVLGLRPGVEATLRPPPVATAAAVVR